jgi:hypothetical protein
MNARISRDNPHPNSAGSKQMVAIPAVKSVKMRRRARNLRAGNINDLTPGGVEGAYGVFDPNSFDHRAVNRSPLF